MSPAEPATPTPDVGWPKQSWFVRGPLLSSIAVIASIAALATELCVMLIGSAPPIGFLGLALSALGVLFIFRARWLGLALTTAGGIASALFGEEYVGIWTVTVFTMFLFARQGRHAAPASAVAATSLYIALTIREGGNLESPVALVAATFCLAAAAAGSAVRLQTETWDAARQRAIDLAAAQAGEVRQAISDERLRIARDLHDGIGHELAVVNVNISVAEVSMPAESTASLSALTAAREGIQRALHETQQILDLLRTSDDATEVRTELARVENIAALVARLNAAGAQVEASIDDVLPELEQDGSAAAYRIAQEVLTNAGKYGSGPVHLTVTRAGDRLVIDATNPTVATASSPRPNGYGIVGMRERAQSVGGSIEVSHAAQTFRVHVEVPAKGA